AQFKRNELRDALLNTATRKMQIREGELLKKDIQRVSKFNPESKAPTRAPGIIDDFEESDYMPLYQMPDNFSSGLWSYSKKGSYSVATEIPATYEGCTFDAVVLNFDRSTFAGKKVKVWIGESKKNPENVVEVVVPDDDNYALEVEFKEPFLVPEDGAYMGYSFDIEEDGAFHLFSAFVDADYNVIPTESESLQMKFGDGGWYYYGDEYGPLYALFRLKSKDATKNSVMPYYFYEIFGTPNEKLDMGLAFLNESGHKMTDFDYKITIDGETIKEGNYTPEEPVLAKSIGYMPLTLTFPKEEGWHSFDFEVSKVNGQPNTCERTVADSCRLYTVAESAHRKSLVYYFENVNHGLSPMVPVADKKLKELYGDDYIPLGLHISDAMSVDKTKSLFLFYYNNPVSMTIDRRYCYLTPYGSYVIEDGEYKLPFTNDKAMDAALARTSEGDVKLTASFVDEEKTAISYSLTTTFNYDRDRNPYSYSVYLVHDDMKGEGDGWDMYNLVSGEYSIFNDDFKDFLEADKSVKGLEYDNVVIDCTLFPLFGIDIDENGPIVKGKEYTVSGTFELEGNPLVQDKDKLRLVVEILNGANGSVMNADMAVPTVATGINTAITDKTATRSIYNANGMRLNGMQKGLNIIEMQNGKRVKVIK
ncbi:MAG: hypothetical protein MSH57_01550, partial [Prevotella sp.]|nr:hypothetical protein [Prevotella sp.]